MCIWRGFRIIEIYNTISAYILLSPSFWLNSGLIEFRWHSSGNGSRIVDWRPCRFNGDCFLRSLLFSRVLSNCPSPYLTMNPEREGDVTLLRDPRSVQFARWEIWQLILPYRTLAWNMHAYQLSLCLFFPSLSRERPFSLKIDISLYILTDLIFIIKENIL